ncbi:MAG: hypothetical protein ACOVP2_05250 [Armatimonadaceae bacterium]
MKIKSLFVGAAGIAAITALSGCSTGSVKGELKVPYAVSTTFTSFGNGQILNSLEATELEVEVNARVVNSLQNTNGAPNATGTFEIEDENLDLEFEGKILYGIIESDQTLNAPTGSISSQVNTALGANIVPAFEGAFGNSNNGTIRGAAFLGTLGGDDDDACDDENANGTFIAVVLDFPTIDLSQYQIGIDKPVTKLVGFAAINADVFNLNNAPAGPAPALEGYVAAGFATKGKLKWNIVPGTPAP